MQYINIELRAPARFRPARPRDSSGALYQGIALVTGVRRDAGFVLLRRRKGERERREREKGERVKEGREKRGKGDRESEKAKREKGRRERGERGSREGRCRERWWNAVHFF